VVVTCFWGGHERKKWLGQEPRVKEEVIKCVEKGENGKKNVTSKNPGRKVKGGKPFMRHNKRSQNKTEERERKGANLGGGTWTLKVCVLSKRRLETLWEGKQGEG